MGRVADEHDARARPAREFGDQLHGVLQDGVLGGAGDELQQLLVPAAVGEVDGDAAGPLVVAGDLRAQPDVRRPTASARALFSAGRGTSRKLWSASS
ncbi:hypothetical protein [Kitasatospora sp. NBC_01266]|uniref:hypothetical protein n=1 Tax=Kitasatospora sp. NBC_01266 TaxID=2903572 RepID=UPI002E30A653|nr:hypothetical protein [Kitasatospora sp. NBC_01266]